MWSRRSFLAVSAGATLLAAGCGKDEPGTVAGDGSVTVKHVFGETRIPAPPKRVVSAGFTGQDELLALGVVPVATTEWFGNEPFAVWPWAQPLLGAAQPLVLSLADGIQVDKIAALEPDLVVATNAGLDQTTYTALSEIAPTVAQAGPDPFFEPWTQQADTIGQAVFKYDEATKLVADVQARFDAIGKETPAFSGKRALVLRGSFFRDHAVVTPAGWRTDYLTRMGFTIPDAIGEYVDGDRALVPRDKMPAVLDDADVLIWTTESDEEQAALLADPTFAELKATRTNRNVLTGKELAGAIAFASVLSYGVVADRLPKLLTGVVG